MDNEKVNDSRNDSVVNMDASLVSDAERQEIREIVSKDHSACLDAYSEQVELAGFFPSLEERCINMSRQRIKPLPGINTGAVSGDVTHEAGMAFLASIKKEMFDSKPEWEKECIKEGRIAGARLDDESFEDDGVTPQDGRPRLTVEYLRSIGYDIDIS
jgi:hypothetical protein